MSIDAVELMVRFVGQTPSTSTSAASTPRSAARGSAGRRLRAALRLTLLAATASSGFTAAASGRVTVVLEREIDQGIIKI
ncbi:hypothetical protein [Sorangium sp. So ce1151]|uniref:hypothetical protein n=1 Tax=Sorangium sp. So ce1151 TaxID=3133332 RepID=UPI003F5DF3F2